MSQVTLGLRERRKLETRQAIAEAAVELFLTQGYDHTTIDQIAEAAGVSPRTFFRYFATKEDVVYADAEDRLAHVLELFDAAPADGSALDALRSTILTLAEETEDQSEYFALQRSLIERHAALQTRGMQVERDFIGALAERLARRVGRPADDIDVRLAAAAVMAAMRVAIETRTFHPERGSLVDQLDHCLSVLEHGLQL